MTETYGVNKTLFDRWVEVCFGTSVKETKDRKTQMTGKGFVKEYFD